MQRTIANEILLAEVGRMLAEGRSVELKTKGSSMLPFIVGDRDSVLLRRHDGIAVGDMVLAEIAPGHYVLHRVFEIDGEKVTLMGDGNLVGKEYCRMEHVLGTVEEIIRPSGRRIRPGDGRIWRRLLPIRRYILAIYRRII